MCLIVFAWQPGQPQPLIVAANRDEFYARPSQAAAPWTETPSLIAGRDLQAGGTWLGISANGRFAALTNIRNPRQLLGERSRGELPAQFLNDQISPEAFLQQLTEQHQHYSGFNLILGTRQELWHFNSHSGVVRCLPAGVYGVSNADLDTPWPKLERAKQALAASLPNPEPDALFRILSDTHRPTDNALPETGVGLETERLLSSVFIASSGYGTRASTLVIANADGSRTLHERSFGPKGEYLAEVRFECPN